MEKGKQTYKLPEGWVEVKLEDVSKQITDGSHNPPKAVDKGIPMLSARNIENDNITFDDVRFIADEEFERENYRTKIETGDVLLTIVATIGRTAVVSDNNIAFTLQRSVAAIKPLIHSKYLMYSFQSPFFQKQLTDNAKGTAQKGVYLRTLRSLKIPLAPLQEQERIVSKIESLYSELDHAEKGLQKAKQQLEVYRQALLKSAFDISQGKTIKLGDNISKITQTIKPSTNSGFKFIGLDSINPGSTKLQLIHKFSNFSSSGSYFRKGNILYSRMRPNLNKVYKAEFEGVCSGEFFVLKCNDKLNADYLKYILHSIEFVSYATNKSKGDRPRLSYGDFASFEIKMIPITEQLHIVEQLDNKFTLIENIADTIDKCFKGIEFLRYSVLKKAFEGKLVQNDTSHESAEKLLSKIQVEKKEYLRVQRETIAQKPKRIQIMENEKTVWQILSKNKTTMRSDKLWTESKHKDDIDAFYAEVKKLIDAGKVIEDKRQGKVSYLKIK